MRHTLEFHFCVIFQILNVMTMKLRAFWDIALCNLAEADPDDEAVSSSETAVHLYKTK